MANYPDDFDYSREWTDEEAFPSISFTKDWNSSEDFPTVETNEATVRADMQQLYNEIKDYLNGTNESELPEEQSWAGRGLKQYMQGAGTGILAEADDYAVLAKSFAIGGTGTRTDMGYNLGDFTDLSLTANTTYYIRLGAGVEPEDPYRYYLFRTGEEAVSIASGWAEARIAGNPKDVSRIKIGSNGPVTDSRRYDLTPYEGTPSSVLFFCDGNGEVIREDADNAWRYKELAAAYMSFTFEDKNRAAASATEAQSYAKGGTSSRTGEDTDNAKYYSEQAASSATIANTKAEAAEAWATGGEEGTPSATNNAKYYSEQAESSATTASTKAGEASGSAAAALGSQTAAAASATEAESYAKGGTSSRAGEDTDNAKYYKEQAASSATIATNKASDASDSATAASGSATTATAKATLAESWAVGGTSSRSGEDTNNAKYYSEQASGSATTASTKAGEAAGSATAASGSAATATAKATLAESWAVGGTNTRTGEDTNNAKYWSDQAQAAAGGGVTSFNSRAGVVTPQSGDYTAAMVGADASGTASSAVSTHNTDATAHANLYVRAGQKSGTHLGDKATAEGTSTTASGNYAHAEGFATLADNTSAHAEGSYTKAKGFSSHAEGYETRATHESQHVFGEYNVLDPSNASASSRGTYVEIVGKGTADNARSNARTLDWDGNETLAGKLTLGAAPTADMDAATKKYVDDSIPSASSASPQMDGTASAGSSTSWAKGDHVHPTDTSRQADMGFVEDTTYSGCFYRNVTVNNQTIKEWLNPPVVLNTEYRTMERFLGKPVYCKAVTVNLPTAQNTSVTTAMNIPNLDVFISIYGTVTVKVNGNHVRINLPDIDTKDTGVFVIGNALDGRLYTQYAMTYTPESATAVAKYTKTTD